MIGIWKIRLMNQKEEIMCQFHNFNELDNMITNILEEGQQEVWKSLEAINEPLERCMQRKLFAEATKQIVEKNL